MNVKLIILVVVSSVALSLLIAMIYALTATKKRSAYQNFSKYNKRFNMYNDFVFTRRRFRQIYSQIAELSIYTFEEARVVTVKTFRKSLLYVVIICGGTWLLFRDFISFIIIGFTAMIMLDTIVYSSINTIQDNMTIAIKRLLPSITDAYKNYNNIPDALRNARVPKILKLRIDSIIDVVTATDGQSKLIVFDQETPNRVLQMLAKACYLHNNSGEDATGHSPFKESIRMIQDEVNIAYIVQTKRNMLFKTLKWLPIITMMFNGVLRIIMPLVMSATRSYYETPISYVCTIITLIISVVCYYIVYTINNPTVAATDDRIGFVLKIWQIPAVTRFSKKLIPNTFKKRHQMQTKLKGCVSSKTLEYWYFEQLMFGIVAVVVSFIATFFILFTAKDAISNGLSTGSMTSIISYTAVEEQKMLEYDHYLLELDALPDQATITKEVRKIMPKLTSSDLEAQVNRIVKKYQLYHNLSFKWQFAFIYIGMFFVGIGLSRYLLNLRASLVKSEAETDVLQMQTMIAILMNTNLDLHDVLYWLMHTSVIFKNALVDAYYTYWRDPYAALRTLSEQSTYPEFINMCERLKNCIDRTTIADSFSDLLADRKVTLEVRQMSELNALSQKRSKAGTIAMIPVIPLLVFSLLFPIGYCVIQTVKSMSFSL